jgi:hypothetical protein
MSDVIKDQLQHCMEEAGKVFCTVVKLKAEPMVTSKWEH